MKVEVGYLTSRKRKKELNYESSSEFFPISTQIKAFLQLAPVLAYPMSCFREPIERKLLVYKVCLVNDLLLVLVPNLFLYTESKATRLLALLTTISSL